MKNFVVTIMLVFAITSFANAPHEKKKKDGVTPEKAMGYLKKGNARYLAGEPRKDGQDQGVRSKQKDKQAPHTIVITCADSRVPPELVFDQKLGEIFTIRVAGEALDHSVIASAEYAVEHLGAKNVFIMGHTACGAVKAAMTTKEGASAGSEHLDALVSDIRPRLKGGRGLASEPSANVEVESATNAEGVASDLLKRSKIMKDAVAGGNVEVHWGLYHIDTGVVDFH